MDLVKLTEELVMAVVTDKDIAQVREFSTEDPKVIQIEVLVSNEDMPKVIGKNGKVINSIRTLVQASSYIKENKIVKINIDSI
jgi:predicted RNA-binding protein YlqC (UPF0109 family)